MTVSTMGTDENPFLLLILETPSQPRLTGAAVPCAMTNSTIIEELLCER